MRGPAPICSDLSRLFLGCNSIYSVTVFPKQGKMEQVTAGCSSKMVVKIGVFTIIDKSDNNQLFVIFTGRVTSIKCNSPKYSASSLASCL